MRRERERERERDVCVLFEFVIFLALRTRLRISKFRVYLCKRSDRRDVLEWLHYKRHLRRWRASVLVF